MPRTRRSFVDAGVAADNVFVFGHVGDGNPHINAIAPDRAGWELAGAALGQQARWALAHGGTIAAEHGAGKLKSGLLELQHGPHIMAAIVALKREFDPAGLLAPGNLLLG